MPDYFDKYRTPSASPAATGSDYFDKYRGSTSPAETEEDGPGMGTGIAAAAAVAAALALTHNTGAAKRIGSELMALRGVSMLSGLASLKSMLGNAGSAAYSSIERGSMAPLKEMFSGETLKDFGQAWKAGTQYEDVAGSVPTLASKANVFGRFMGSADTAAQNALKRAGMTEQEAAIEMLQRPLPHALSESLDSPVMRYAVPFRKTPFNQFAEGARTLGDWETTGKKVANAVSVGQGMATGMSTDDPTATALSISAGGKRGMGVAVGDVLGRLMNGESANKAGQGIQGMSPVADTSLGRSVTQPFTDPIGMFKPAAVSSIDKLLAMFGK